MNASDAFQRLRRWTIHIVMIIAVSLVAAAPVLAGQDGALTWTEDAPTQVITPEEVQELIGVPAENVRVLWSVDYSTEQYPVVVKLRAHGTDGLPVYVFGYTDAGWSLLGSGAGPELGVTVNQDGPLSLAVTAPEKRSEPAGESITDADRGAEVIDRPEENAEASSSQNEAAEAYPSGGNIKMWLLAAALVIAGAILGVLALAVIGGGWYFKVYKPKHEDYDDDDEGMEYDDSDEESDD